MLLGQGVPSYAPSDAEVLDDDDATNNGKRDSIEKIKCLPQSGEKEELEHHVGGEGREEALFHSFTVAY